MELKKSSKRYLRSIRLLVECYHAFEQVSATQARKAGLTPSQFDIIATLGNTPGMTFKELGEKTLITKGTLTGVIDRLEAKGFVQRGCHEDDRRSTIVQLTEDGEKEFERVFASHVEFCKLPFASYQEKDFLALERELGKLKAQMDAAAEKRSEEEL